MSKNGKKDVGLQPTSGRAWREKQRAHREQGVAIELPSGFTAQLRALDFSIMIKMGKLPNSLLGLVMEQFIGGKKKAEIDAVKNFEEYQQLLDAVTETAFVSPRIVENPTKEDEISIDDVDDVDKQFCMTVLGKSARDLERFRDKQIAAMESVRDSDGDEPTAEPSAESEAVGAG